MNVEVVGADPKQIAMRQRDEGAAAIGTQNRSQARDLHLQGVPTGRLVDRPERLDQPVLRECFVGMDEQDAKQSARFRAQPKRLARLYNLALTG